MLLDLTSVPSCLTFTMLIHFFLENSFRYDGIVFILEHLKELQVDESYFPDFCRRGRGKAHLICLYYCLLKGIMARELRIRASVSSVLQCLGEAMGFPDGSPHWKSAISSAAAVRGK